MNVIPADDFTHDVFLSHSSKDKAVVRVVAERLRKDGLRVWLDDWEIRPGDSIPAKIEDGLEHSRARSSGRNFPAKADSASWISSGSNRGADVRAR